MNSELYNIQDTKELYYLLTGLTYREIGKKFYQYNTNKFVYRVKKMMKKLNLCNRRQLIYFAIKNNILVLDRIKGFI